MSQSNQTSSQSLGSKAQNQPITPHQDNTLNIFNVNTALSSSVQVVEQADLTALNTMQLACQADYFVKLNDEKHLIDLIAYIQQHHPRLFLLSGGSNVLLPPKLHAFVLQPNFKGIHILNESEQSVDIEVMAGENWHNLVTYTVNKGWYGLENLALIPGLVGAAPIQNIGAYGVQLEDRMTHVKALHLPTLTWHELDNAACEFDYRDSKFKRESDDWLISRVGFRLHKQANQVNANYGDISSLAKSIAQQDNRNIINAHDVMQAIITTRQQKLPDPNQLPNCGSFFKNPIISTDQFITLKQKYPNMVGYTVDDKNTKVAAGWLIDHAGLRGEGISPIFSHTKQALVLVNQTPIDSKTPASQTDVLNTQRYIQNKIQEMFDIQLQREPILVDG